jgi:hypothetical protein
MSFSVPTKGALPPGSSRRAPIDLDAPFPETSFVRLSNSPVMTPLPQVPQRGPYGEMPVSRAFSYISHGIPNKESLLVKQSLTFLRVPGKGAPMQGPLWRERDHASRASRLAMHSYISEFPVKFHQQEENMVTVHGAERGRMAYIQ